VKESAQRRNIAASAWRASARGEGIEAGSVLYQAAEKTCKWRRNISINDRRHGAGVTAAAKYQRDIWRKSGSGGVIK